MIAGRHLEPFIDKQGRRSMAVLHPGGVGGAKAFAYPETEWNKPGGIVGKEDSQTYADLAINNRWPLPRADLADFHGPFPTMEDMATRIIRYLRRYVYVRDDCLYEAMAAWVISTYFRDCFYYAPLLVFDGLTVCGKSTAIQALAQIVYRGEIFDSASGPSIAREIEDYGSTILLDEVLDTLGSDRGMDLYSLLKSCFWHEGRWIRADPKGRRNYRYGVYTTVALTIRGDQIPVDLNNRAIKINMTAAPRNVKLGDILSWREDDTGEEDSPDTIRDELYRLKILSMCKPDHPSAVDMQRHRRRVTDHVKRQCEDGQWYYAYVNGMPKDSPAIGNRDRNIASTLYAVGLASDMERPVMEAIILNAKNRSEDVFDTLEAITFSAFMDLVLESLGPYAGEHFGGDRVLDAISHISTSDIAYRVNEILIEQGNAGRDPVATKTVTAKLAAMGLKYKRSGGRGKNKSWMDADDPYMLQLFLSHAKTFCPEDYEYLREKGVNKVPKG